MEENLDIELEVDDNLNGILLITCPGCQNIIKQKLKDLDPGSAVTCTCKTSFNISDDGFRSAQRSLDDFKKTLRKLGT